MLRPAFLPCLTKHFLVYAGSIYTEKAVGCVRSAEFSSPNLQDVTFSEILSLRKTLLRSKVPGNCQVEVRHPHGCMS